jgi:hypothetical protein
MVDERIAKLPVSHFATWLYGYNRLSRLSVPVTAMTGAVNVKVSVFNTDL